MNAETTPEVTLVIKLGADTIPPVQEAVLRLLEVLATDSSTITRTEPEEPIWLVKANFVDSFEESRQPTASRAFRCVHWYASKSTETSRLGLIRNGGHGHERSSTVCLQDLNRLFAEPGHKHRLLSLTNFGEKCYEVWAEYMGLDEESSSLPPG